MFCGTTVGLPGRCLPMCWATARAQRSYPPPTPKPMIIRKVFPASALVAGWAAAGTAALNTINPISPAAAVFLVVFLAVFLAMSALPRRDARRRWRNARPLLAPKRLLLPELPRTRFDTLHGYVR